MIYWWNKDWWVYTEIHDEPIPKFIMPLWFQVLVSSIVGLVGGGILACVWSLARWVKRRLSQASLP